MRLEIFCRAGVIFPEAGAGDFFAGAGDFFAGVGAGAGGEKPGVCTALTVAYHQLKRHNARLYIETALL